MGRHISSDIISIHALREEGDTAAVVGTAATCGFLSTPSVRRATTKKNRKHQRCKISIHALREEGDRLWPERRRQRHISIHALREEGDLAVFEDELGTFTFLSTPSVRRATILWDNFKQFMGISIHALREEGDPEKSRSSTAVLHFYPRPP